MNGIRKGLKTIVWDVDDVLNELMKNWFELFWLPDNPDSQITYNDITENPPHQLLGISNQTYLDSLDEFRWSEHARNMKPVPAILQWFKLNGGNFHHIALTATPLQTASKSADWVFRHYGAWIRSFNFVPSRRVYENITPFYETKADFLQWWQKADIFVDDNPGNLAGAEGLGIRAVCIPQPWNDSKHTLTETLNILTGLS